jgi:TonB family protein
MSGTLGLDDAAVQAAAKWMFDAGKLHGRSVPVAWAIVFEFKDGAPAVGQLSPPLVPAPDADFAKGVRDAMAPGIVAPRLLERVDPKYPSLALQEKIQGEVWMRAVVLEDGSIGDVQVTKSLDREHGMDDAAVAAAKKWKFRPATENGKPIPVVVTITMEFRARSH